MQAPLLQGTDSQGRCTLLPKQEPFREGTPRWLPKNCSEEITFWWVSRVLESCVPVTSPCPERRLWDDPQCSARCCPCQPRAPSPWGAAMLPRSSEVRAREGGYSRQGWPNVKPISPKPARCTWARGSPRSSAHAKRWTGQAMTRWSAGLASCKPEIWLPPHLSELRRFLPTPAMPGCSVKEWGSLSGAGGWGRAPRGGWAAQPCWAQLPQGRDGYWGAEGVGWGRGGKVAGKPWASGGRCCQGPLRLLWGMDPTWKTQKRPSSPQGHGSLAWLRLKFSVFHKIPSRFSFPQPDRHSRSALGRVAQPSSRKVARGPVAGLAAWGLRAAPPGPVLLQRRSRCGRTGTGREVALGLLLPPTTCLAPGSSHGGGVARSLLVSALTLALCRLEAVWLRP